MPHMHYCDVCKVPVAMCSDDSCSGEVDSHPNATGHHNGGGDPRKLPNHYCTIHHPDPEYFRELTPPPKRG